MKRPTRSDGLALELPDGRILSGLHLLPRHGQVQSTFSSTSNFTYLACIDTARVPLYLVASSLLVLSDEGAEARQWLTETIWRVASDLGSSSSQSDPACSESLSEPCKSPGTAHLLLSRVGLLFKVDSSTLSSPLEDSPHPVTELLFFANESTPTSKALTIHALPISSHLLDLASSITTQGSTEDDHGTSLHHPSNTTATNPQVPTPQSPPKHHLETLFNSADDQRRKARRRGGSSISLAASRALGPSPIIPPQILTSTSPTLDESNIRTSINILQPRHIRPSPITAPPPPPTNQALTSTSPTFLPAPTLPRPPSRSASESRKRSSLSQVRTPDEALEETSFAARNKHTISKTVMACMRMWGFESAGGRRGKGDFGGAVGEVGGAGGTFETGIGVVEDEDVSRVPERERAEEEYKAVYHQTYKGAAFALRRDIEVRLVGSDAVREVVERLLVVFVGGGDGVGG